MKKVSVITINRNNKEGLEKTIKSVIAQNFDDYEFIVIDGASTDGSAQLAESYIDHITYYKSEPDKGIYEAMNKGIKAANGKYYHFLNSGDIYASDHVLSDIFTEDSDEPFLCGNFYVDYTTGRVKSEPYKGRDWIFSLYEIFADGLCHQAFFIKYDMFQKYGYYDEQLRIASDFKLFFIAIGIHQETVKYFDTEVVIYDTQGFSSNIGGIAITNEKILIAQQELPEKIFRRIKHLQFLERNGYITSFVMSKKWIQVLFKAFNKFCITLRLTKVDHNV